MKEVTIYTDGACSGNPGPGGYGVVLSYQGKEKELSAGYRTTTNNRMELMGVIAGLSALKERCRVTLFSDSKYVVEAITRGWAEGWQKNGWRRKGGSVRNPDLWQKLLPLLDTHAVEFVWVKGHADNVHNNRCDTLARAAAESPHLDDTGYSEA